jgi:DNA-binding transcriptional MocR family regulator
LSQAPGIGISTRVPRIYKYLYFRPIPAHLTGSGSSKHINQGGTIEHDLYLKTKRYIRIGYTLSLSILPYTTLAAMALSSRGQEMALPNDKNLLWDVIKDLWHPSTKPSGYLNLGVAKNALLQDKLLKHALDNLELTTTTLTYSDGPTRSRHLKTTMATFLTKYLQPIEPLQASHINITNGCTSAIEHLTWLLCNPSSSILLGQPCSRGFWSFIESRTDTKIITVPFSNTDPFTSSAVVSYESAILRAREQNQPLSALLLCNPHNPTGRCYSRACPHRAHASLPGI